MKKNKVNKLKEAQQLDELGLSSFIGDFGAAAVKSMFSGKGLKNQMIQDMFLKDFYEDGITSLENAIRGGLVDPNIRGTTEVNPADARPGQGQPGATAPAVAANKAQQQTTQNLNNYVKNAAATINKETDKNQKLALTKELVNAMADRQGTPEWNNALGTVQTVIKNAGLGPGTMRDALDSVKAGKIMSEAWRIYFANMLVEAVGLTWQELGLCVLRENKQYYIAEVKYTKLNSLFESIVNLTENDGKQSISQYMMNWFNQYMAGVNWQSQKQLITNTFNNLQNTYPKGYKDQIKTLAKTAYALSKSSTSMPLGMKDELSKMKNDPNAQAAANAAGTGGAAPAAAAPAAATLSTQLQQLAKTDPAGYNKLIASLKPISTPPVAPAPAATTSESRRRK